MIYNVLIISFNALVFKYNYYNFNDKIYQLCAFRENDLTEILFTIQNDFDNHKLLINSFLIPILLNHE